jgi:propanediol dehydratase small subunit
MEENFNRIAELVRENDSLKWEIFNLKNEKKCSKENELKEFIGKLYNSVVEELIKKDSRYDADEYNKLTKEDILDNLKQYIDGFKREYRL